MENAKAPLIGVMLSLSTLSSHVNPPRKIMKTLLIALALTAASSAFAAGDTQEATPYTNSKAQAHGEERKKARPATGVKRSKDGSTARGEGSGVPETSKAEARGQEKANAREAMPHKETTPGSTPK